MPEISLRELTIDNWREAAGLRVSEDQAGFVAPNVYSIALSKFRPNLTPYAIYSGDTMVGFVMVGDAGDGQWRIPRFMIDERYQGKGYGRAAMQEIIRTLKARDGCRSISIIYLPENEVTRRLYAALGFRETGEVINGEVVAEIKAAPEQTL